MTLDFIATGPEWLTEYGRGRHKIPNFLTYTIALCVVTYLSIVFYIPAIGAIFRGYLFKLKSDSIELPSGNLKKEEIEAYRINARGIFFLHNGKTHYVPYNLNLNAKKALDEFAAGLDRED